MRVSGLFYLRLLGALLATIMGLAAGPALAAQPVEACIARDKGTATKFDCGPAQRDKGSGDFLVPLRFDPIRINPHDPLVYRQTSVWQDGSTIRFRYADNHIEAISYSSQTASRYMTIGAILEFPVPYSKAALTGITVQTRGSANLRGIVLGPELLTQSQSWKIKLRLAVLYATFAGLTIALLVFNLSLWAAMRHRFQLIYCAMVASLSLYAFTSSGTVMLLLPGIANNDRLRMNYVLLALTGVTAFQFICHFFGPKLLGPKLRSAVRWLSVAALAGSLSFALLAPWQIWPLDRFYFLSLGGLLILLPPIMFRAWQMRSRYFWVFVCAWSAPAFSSTLRFLHGLGLIEYNFLLDNGNLIALAVESLLSALLVTARLRELSTERDSALIGEQHARRLASTDPLTGLLNRRAFLDLAIGRKGRQRLMLIDIDYFKRVNDRLGHAAGDEVLRAVAIAIQDCRSRGCLAVRLGGEEFALLLPRSGISECSPDDVLEAVRNCPMPQGEQVTVSVGFADGVVNSEENWKRLYRLADSALYRAKNDGRDRACRATDFRAAA
jgi:diguanylate cyclase (GGDEF)-like protein